MLLAFAKQREVQARATDANELLRTLELFLKYGAGSEARIILELSPRNPDCLIDPSQFNATILNVVLNARDAMPKGEEVWISTAPWIVKPVPLTLRLAIICACGSGITGPGMPDGVLQSIFDPPPFFTTKGEQGTGLGLSQVGPFMRQIGRHIRVASGVGQGTTFDLFFPAAGPTTLVFVLRTLGSHTLCTRLPN